MSVNPNILEWTPDYLTKNEDSCRQYLKQDHIWSSIPLINTTESRSQYFENMKLIRFRGMIQDMYNPEFYYEQFEVIHRETKESFVRNGKYMDVIQCGENEIINVDGLKNVTKERNTFIVISVPGLNSWAETFEIEQNGITTLTDQSSPNKPTKRSLEIDEQMDTDPCSLPNASSNDDTKKLCTEKNKTPESSKFLHDDLLNYPIPKRTGKTCIMKIYQDYEDLKLNELIEFVGFLSSHPILGQISSNEFENEMEIQAHHPPPSLIPRIHCVSWKKLIHSNPLLHVNKIDNGNALDIKKELLFVLTQLLLGDELAAEYLICHLISKVYLRADMLALGKFTLNISNIPAQKYSDYVQQLYEILEMFLPKSHYLPMTIENISETKFVPQKNYEYNRLNSGLLQLSSNTHLVLDETKLSPGRLNAPGVHNVKALSNVIKFQKTEYDFNYYQMEFDCDIPCLILSEGKSFLPSDFHIPLRSDNNFVDIFPEVVEAVKTYLKPELLNRIRIYITQSRHNSYELPGDVQEVVEEEFIQMRKAKKASAEDLHNLLVLARLKCLSEGKNTFNKDCWENACHMENIRKERLDALKT